MKNEIVVRLDKGQYIGGEVIHGVVYVNCLTPVPAKSLKLKLKGMEKTIWEETELQQRGDGTSEHVTITRGGSRDFFKMEFHLVSFPGIYAPGTYAYPFQWALPPGLPGSFHESHGSLGSGLHLGCQIRYQIKAILDIPGTKHDLKHKVHLAVIDKLDTTIQPQHHKKIGTVRFLCCIPKGDLECEAWMDKNAYCANETAQIHMAVKNNSTVNVDNFAVKLMRTLIVRDKSGHTKHLVTTVCKEKYPGTPALTSRESDVPLPLVANGKPIQQSVRSDLIECKYHVDIECQIPWSPDIEIHAPVEIYEPISPGWSGFQMPPWVGQCVVQRVDACALDAALAATLLTGAIFGLRF
eukprot:Opistho-2@45274